MEEMKFEISVGSKIITIEHQYPDFGIIMSAYLCEPLSSYFKLIEHISADWKSVEELNSLNWADADVKVVDAIMANLKWLFLWLGEIKKVWDCHTFLGDYVVV